MADSVIDGDYIILFDNWPGAPVQCYDMPTDGFIGATHHDVATAVYPVGTKVQVYQDGSGDGQVGWSTFVYLNLDVQAGDPTVAAKIVTVPVATATGIYHVTADPDTNCLDPGSALCGVALSAMVTDAYYGWFWCAGVSPEDYVTGLAGDFQTVGDVAIGPIGVGDVVDVDFLGFSIAATTLGVVGYAIKADD